MKTKSKMCYSYWKIPMILVLLASHNALKGQTSLVSSPLFHHAKKLTKTFPASINEAYDQRMKIISVYDSLQRAITNAYPTLANRINRRSARLNAMINVTEPNQKLSLAPPNQKMTTFFLNQWDRMDALEAKFSRSAPSVFPDKQLYHQKGYVPVWDSVYKSRLAALVQYRDGVLKLVEADMTYLNNNARMFNSKNEDERMQWVETELGVLQKLVLLSSKFQKVVLNDGIEKVEYCVENPGACN